MNRTQPHPLEVVIVAALVVAESLLTLVVAGVALLLTLTQWSGRSAKQARFARLTAPAPVAEPEPTQALPQLHPLALLAADLEALPAVTLRSLANVRSKRHTKRQLIAMVAAMA